MHVGNERAGQVQEDRSNIYRLFFHIQEAGAQGPLASVHLLLTLHLPCKVTCTEYHCRCLWQLDTMTCGLKEKPTTDRVQACHCSTLWKAEAQQLTSHFLEVIQFSCLPWKAGSFCLENMHVVLKMQRHRIG